MILSENQDMMMIRFIKNITKNTNILPRNVFDCSGNFHCVIFVEQKGMVEQCKILIFPLIYLYWVNQSLSTKVSQVIAHVVKPYNILCKKCFLLNQSFDKSISRYFYKLLKVNTSLYINVQSSYVS